MSTLQELFNKAKGVQETNLWDLCAAAGYTADRRYRPGEISEKTGLQKQPDGSWKEPVHAAVIKNEDITSLSHISMEPDFEPLPAVKTTKNAENHLKSLGFFKKESLINFEGMDLNSAKSVVFVCKEFFSAFPKMKNFLSGIEQSSELPSDYAAVYNPKAQKIFLNINGYNNYRFIQLQRYYAVEEYFSPPGTTAKDYFTHELGHAISHYIAQKKGMPVEAYCKQLRDSVLESVKDNKEFDISRVFHVDGLTKEQSTIYNLRANATSERGAENELEFIAEAFSEYFSSKEPRIVARLIGEQIKKELA